MIRLMFLLFFTVQVGNTASFTYPDFKQCYKKNRDSFIYFGSLRAVAVSKHLAVAYSKDEPKVAYVKFDPFLNLYLFHSKKTLKPVKLRSTSFLKLGDWVAGMDDLSLYVGNFAKSGDLLDSFYLQNAKLDANSIISCLCCQVYGLGVGEGSFVGSEYIKRFMSSGSGGVFYGDIGVRFDRYADDFVVKSLNPFYPNQTLRVGDKVLQVNGKKVKSLKQLNQTVLFAAPKSKIKIEFLRGKKKLTRELSVISRLGGGGLSDSFLEKKGIFFDKNLKIVRVKKDSVAKMYGLKVGDKLLQMNDKIVHNQDDIKEYLSRTKSEDAQLLFSRDDFQFFVKVKI